MTPDDVLIEAISAALLHGDSPYLRELMCLKLKEAIGKLAQQDQAVQLTFIKSAKE